MSNSTEPASGEGIACIDCQPDPSHPSASSTSAAAAAASATSTAPSAPSAPPENLLDPTTFIPPISATAGLPTPLVVIEYCQRCKFGLRANWIQQELLSTFAPSTTTDDDDNASTASIASVMLIPKVDEPSAGRFRVYILPPPPKAQEKAALKLLWDRKVEGGFPEMRVLKQKVRDLVNPNFGLGHSDKK